MRLFVVSNWGEYASDVGSWTTLIDCARIFTSRAKAQGFRCRINNRYGFDRCNVEELKEEDWNCRCWQKLQTLAE